jgi:tyrosine-protein phosphatase YwqE
MMETGLVDFIASDAHNLSSRKVNLSDAFKEVSKRYGEETASRLLGSNGKAMVKQL